MKNSNQATKLPMLVTITLLTLIFFSLTPGCARENLKGNLNKEELNFIDNIFYPILIESKICVSAKKDCNANEYIICFSTGSLSCDVYGITDEKVIKKILLSMLNSGLKVSSFNFWRSRYHKNTFFEKPIFSFTDNTGDK